MVPIFKSIHVFLNEIVQICAEYYKNLPPERYNFLTKHRLNMNFQFTRTKMDELQGLFHLYNNNNNL